MAEVFLARGTGAGGIGKFFAVKRILPQYADSPEFIDMFKDEAKIAINLNHSNIVSIHEFGVEKGIFYLVMDYVEGRNLRQILNKMKKSSLQFSMDQIVYIVKEVAAGLDHAHRCIDGSTGKPLNITHRDMSPQNLMVSFEGEVKIVDFGIAKAESQLETTRAGTLKGKFGYMSPEQAEGQPVDLRTDIFSLGIVVWELLANDRLFVANNEINTLRKIRDCQIPSLRKINPNIHTELERIVQKALARDRNLRYQTGAALHRDLNRFLNRQYPDFSPQDFSVFIKSVFADEILSLRKRLVEYSKVNLGQNTKVTATGDKHFDDRTSLLNTDTNSLIVSESSLINDDNDSAIPTKDAITAKDVADTKEHAAADTGSNSAKVTFTGATDSNSLEIASMPKAFNTNNEGLPSTSKVKSSNGNVLDTSALEAEMQREISVKVKMPVAIETEEVSSPSISRQTRTYSNRASVRMPQAPRKEQKPMRMATFLVFGMMCVGIYAYLVKYFQPMMTDVIVAMDPYVHPFHKIIGVDIHSSDWASRNGPKPTSMPPVTQEPVQPKTNPEVPPPIEDEASATSLIVISNPSGAEIYINDKNTGIVTPSRVEIPHGNFDLTLHKPGYQDVRVRDTSRERLGHRYVASLVKMNVAYIDVDVFPPQDAVFYVNDKRVKAPIRQLPVAANVPIHVRAVNKTGTAYDETTVTLPVDRRQTIQLNPRHPLRLPSNSSSD